MNEDKRARATRLANSRDTPSLIDLHWLVSEAIGAWNKAENLQATIDRHIEREAFDDYNAMNLGSATALPWAQLPEPERQVYRDAAAADFWRN